MNLIGAECLRLPPLILHPFSTPEDTAILVESSRASLTLQGFLPQEDVALEELDNRLLRGRYAELRMLYYIGKDLTRWTEQCVEMIRPDDEESARQRTPETFAVFIVEHTPAHVRTKLEGWGVLDFCALFRRAIGLHSVFAELPPADGFLPEFLRKYHRYVDSWYEQKLRDATFERPLATDFTFELYASGEYTLMLEQSWAADAPSL